MDGSWRDPSSTIDSSRRRFINSVVDVDCVVGADVVLEDSVLLPGAVVQSGCEIRSSIIGPEAVIGSGSILGPTCVVGAKEHVAADSQSLGRRAPRRGLISERDRRSCMTNDVLTD